MDALTEIRRPNLMLNQNPRQTPLSGPAREIFSLLAPRSESSTGSFAVLEDCPPHAGRNADSLPVFVLRLVPFPQGEALCSVLLKKERSAPSGRKPAPAAHPVRRKGNAGRSAQRAERQPRTATFRPFRRFRPFRTFRLSEDSAPSGDSGPSEDSGPSDSSGDSLPSGPFVLRKGRTL